MAPPMIPPTVVYRDPGTLTDLTNASRKPRMTKNSPKPTMMPLKKRTSPSPRKSS
jgi:hypothetical protein